MPIAAFAVMVLLGGCASVDDATLSAELSPLAKVGVPVNETMVHLQKAGFVCAFMGEDVACDRVVYKQVVVKCFERVTLVGARRSDIVSDIKFGPNFCPRAGDGPPA